MGTTIAVFLIAMLTACVPTVESPAAKTPTPTDALTSDAFFTPTALLVTGTSLPTVFSTPLVPTALPSTQTWAYTAITPEPAELERWREYEEALGYAISAIYGRVPCEDILCEWVILGRDAGKVYVSAVCSGIYPYGLITSGRCAVVYLGADGEVQKALTTEGISAPPAIGRRKLFPSGIYERCIHTPDDRMKTHLESRRANPEPPLIVLDATPMP